MVYKRSGSFETSIGGVCSIFSFTVLLYWLALNLWETFAPPGKFKDTVQKLAIETTNGEYDALSVPISSLFTAYYIETRNEDITDIDNYVIGLWF